MARVLEDDPENKALSRRAFVLFLGAGQVDKAIEIAELMEGRESGMTTAFLLLAARDVKEGDYTKAQERLKNLPEQGLARYAKLWQARIDGTGDFEGAFKLLEPLFNESGFVSLMNLHLALLNEQRAISPKPMRFIRRRRKKYKTPLVWYVRRVL